MNYDNGCNPTDFGSISMSVLRLRRLIQFALKDAAESANNPENVH